MRRVHSLALVTLLLAGCGGGGAGVVQPSNNPPTISFTYTPLAVPKGGTVDLSVAVSDPDDDQLTVTWDITRGTLIPLDAANTQMRWAVPNAFGTDTATVSVTDGKLTRRVKAPLVVATLDPSQTAPALYTKTGSPYILLPGNTPARLTVYTTQVDSGVVFYVGVKGMTIDVVGSLTLKGTSNEPVVFRPNDRTVFCGDQRGWWEGIYSETGHIVMDHAEVTYGNNGLRLRDTARATVRKSLIRCSNANGVLMEGAGALVIEDSEITDGVSNGLTIQGALLPDSVVVRRSYIGVNGNSGISINLSTDSPPPGAVPITITDNKLELNSVHGIVIENRGFPNVHYNAFVFNGAGSSNFYLQRGYPVGVSYPTLDVTCNYWGLTTANQSSIEATMHDHLDDPGNIGTTLAVSPWLNEDPFGQSSHPPCTGGLR